MRNYHLQVAWKSWRLVLDKRLESILMYILSPFLGEHRLASAGGLSLGTDSALFLLMYGVVCCLSDGRIMFVSIPLGRLERNDNN